MRDRLRGCASLGCWQAPADIADRAGLENLIGETAVRITIETSGQVGLELVAARGW